MRERLFLLLLLVPLVVDRVPAAHAADSSGDRSMRMYRDPDTGRVGAPSAAALRAEAAARPAAESPPVSEEPVRAPAGGVKINLRGSHRPAVVRFADPGAPPRHECVEGGGAR